MSGVARNRIGYIICATPRSGSTLLCDLLAATGVAGRPDSFFRRQTFSWWAGYLGVNTSAWPSDNAFDRDYLDAIIREGRGDSAVFGMRLMQENLSELITRLGFLYPGHEQDVGLLQSVFGPLRFIHLSREDKVSQAVSRVRAEQSGLWHVNADGSERERMHPAAATRYDGDAIRAHLLQLEHDDAAWENWFMRQNITPLRIRYHRLSRDPRGVLASTLSNLDIDPGFAGTVQPVTQKLSDALNEAWRNRYLRESGMASEPFNVRS